MLESGLVLSYLCHYLIAFLLNFVLSGIPIRKYLEALKCDNTRPDPCFFASFFEFLVLEYEKQILNGGLKCSQLYIIISVFVKIVSAEIANARSVLVVNNCRKLLNQAKGCTLLIYVHP